MMLFWKDPGCLRSEPHGVEMSKDVQLSWSQALQIVPYPPPSTLHPFSISTKITIIIIIVIIVIIMYIIIVGRIKSAAMKILQN